MENNVTDNNDPSNNNGMNDPVMNGVDMNNPNVNGPVCANNYMGLGPIYPAAYYKEKAKPVYGKAECILSPLIFLFSVLFIRYVVFNVTGLILDPATRGICGAIMKNIAGIAV